MFVLCVQLFICVGTNSKKYDTKDWIIRPTYGKVRRAWKYFKFLLILIYSCRSAGPAKRGAHARFAYIAIYFPVESREGSVLGHMKRSLGRELVFSK